jgi:hypothetical protein
MKPSWNSRRGTAVVEQPSWNSRRGMGSFRKSVRRSGVFFDERNEEVGHYRQTLINLDDVAAKLVPYLAPSTT